ncbi:hypothetical protein K4K49_004935 [Colletotrichum sp. SAR 10_70]|nr:hypothetical protein K4K50_009071 [Colletotrichum sp. SAR 10_71]KAI8168829.1 hypothetical protein K4K49_004935 [Colletotrichum sp. SAR 10_70]
MANHSRDQRTPHLREKSSAFSRGVESSPRCPHPVQEPFPFTASEYDPEELLRAISEYHRSTYPGAFAFILAISQTPQLGLSCWTGGKISSVSLTSGCCQRILHAAAISRKYESFFDEVYADLLTRLRQKADIQWGKQSSSALSLIQQSPPATAVLITDAALTEESPKVWDAIIAYVGQGGSAIAMDHFSSSVKPNEIRPFFAKDWESGDYHRTTVALYAQIAGSTAERLPTQYSQKAQFLKGVHPHAILYGPHKTSVTESRVFPT